MQTKKHIISIGHINKYIIFALIGGVSKCIVSMMLYIFSDYANYNKHPLIIGWNAGIGMSLAIVPLLLLKLSSHREQKRMEKGTLLKAFTSNSKINNNINFTNTKSAFSGLEYIEKYDKKKLKIQKYLILLACAVLDFGQKFLTFLLKKYIINNIWMFNIVFISVFEYLITKAKLYKHQYISSIVIILLGIAATIVGLVEEDNENLYIKFILCIFIEIMYSLAIVLAKYLMDYRSCSPYDITFYEGIFALFVNSVLLAIFTNIPLPDDEKYDKIFRLTTYEGKKYLDNFYSCFKDMGFGESCLFVLSAFGRIFSNLFGHIVIKHFTSSHIILVLILGEMALVFKEDQGWVNITQFIIFCFALFMLLIFTEIIEINVCDLEKNTRKNIEIREKLDSNEEGRDTKGILDDDIEIELNSRNSDTNVDNNTLDSSTINNISREEVN